MNEPTMTLTDDRTGYSIKCRPVYSTEICREVILTFETVEEASKVFQFIWGRTGRKAPRLKRKRVRASAES
jgi:hypothetical protein